MITLGGLAFVAVVFLLNLCVLIGLIAVIGWGAKRIRLQLADTRRPRPRLDLAIPVLVVIGAALCFLAVVFSGGLLI